MLATREPQILVFVDEICWVTQPVARSETHLSLARSGIVSDTKYLNRYVANEENFLDKFRINCHTLQLLVNRNSMRYAQ